jgi:hypothetical protein
MRFITIKTPKIPIPRRYPEEGTIEEGSSIAVNVDSICSIEHRNGLISLFLSNEEEILTMFTSIESAVDYIQRAPSMSMGVS